MTAVTRRDFMALLALGASTPLLAASATTRAQPRLRPFALSDVRLSAGPVRDALEVNCRALMALDPERLLHMFRITAGLPSAAEPLGGWEAPDNELRGHYTGHHLSALALLTAQTGDSAARERGRYLAAELARCQATIGSGYLSAFPEDLFDRLRAGKPAWAPFYTLHKILAGLLDTAELSEDPAALATAVRLGAWVERWVQPLGEDAMQRVLEREFGGMNDALFRLSVLSGESRFMNLGRRFDHERIYAPLAAGRDELNGLHANTTIPKVIGALRGYELTGDARLLRIARSFERVVTEDHSYCTGGSSNGENWNTSAGTLKGELSGYTQECCVSYNLQKLARALHGISGEAALMDTYERLYWNGIMGVQHPRDGDKLYYVPLAGGFWKLFGTPLADFWCCTGSMAESFAKLGDAIYWHDDEALTVNLFVPSEVRWHDRGISLVQQTRFPDDGSVRLTVRAARPTRITLRVRIPGWSEGASATLNGRPLQAVASPSSYLVVTREWRDGDVLALELPMSVRAEALLGDSAQVALLHGPIVLAARLGAHGLDAQTLRAPPTRPRLVPEYPLEPVAVPSVPAAIREPARYLTPIAGRTLEYRTLTGPPLEFVPLHRIFDERFAVYLPVAETTVAVG